MSNSTGITDYVMPDLSEKREHVHIHYTGSDFIPMITYPDR